MLPSGRGGDPDAAPAPTRSSGSGSAATTSSTPHGSPSPGIAQATSRPAWFVAERSLVGSASTTVPGSAERRAEHAERARQLDEARRRARRRRRSGVEPAAVRAARPRHGSRRGRSRIARRAALSGASGLVSASRIAEPLSADSSPTRASIAWCSSSGRRTAPRPARGGAGRARRRAAAVWPVASLGGEEPLEVADAGSAGRRAG